MRQIKFRAWDEKLKMMMPEVDLSGPLQSYKWLGRTDLPIMQFTGLLDKNGKEIYEGDIVKCRHIDVPAQVVYEIALGYGLRDTKNHWQGQLKTYAEDYEIIGNIYENPELLEDNIK